jgi:hypothetical protein
MVRVPVWKTGDGGQFYLGIALLSLKIYKWQENKIKMSIITKLS